MNVDFSAEEKEFEQEVRTFFETKYPADLKEKSDNGVHWTKEDYVRWQKILYEQGWAAINWPVEHGGTGWTVIQKYIFWREMARVNAPDVIPFGIKMVAPVIYTFGTQEQCERFLPDILATNEFWVQGYSEPGSGSDLASLKTRAVRDGDHYVVNGTKTWTTLGHFGDWIFCLVRTETDTARRQEGISFLLIDMSTPGVTVKPIITIEGGHEVNEIHFEDVRVPVDNLVGEEGKGWTYGKVLLQHERTNGALVARSQHNLRKLRAKASQSIHGAPPLLEDQSFRRQLAKIEIELKALEFTFLRILAAVSIGKAPGPESSLLKLRATEIIQGIDELMVKAAGYYALPYVPDQYAADFPVENRVGFRNETNAAAVFFNNRKQTIFAGSNEIQRNIISKHVLGL